MLDAAERARAAVAVADVAFTELVGPYLDPSVFAEVLVDGDEGFGPLVAWVRVPGYPAPPNLPPRAVRPPVPAPPAEPARAGATINVGYVRGDVIGGDKYVGG